MKGFRFAAAAAVVAAAAATAPAEDKAVTAPLDLKMKGIDGKEMDLAKYKGKVVLVVNVASKCGYTPQYKGLEELYAKYGKDGLVVLGVPSNDFGKQEPGTEEDIQKFCTTNYKVTFPMTAKVVVKGDDKAELYKRLTAATDNKEIGWNFEKFLIGRDGKVVGRYKSSVAPESDDLGKAIKTELEKK
ncbi:MAG: glutathione peroxidase [Gemmataceae bacterium]|nr:glutathione peroxidase [Gemmataceae bacterium]